MDNLSTSIDLKARITNDFGYHRATDLTTPMHESVRANFRILALALVDIMPTTSRELSLALTALQEAQMWANAAIAVNISPLEVQ